MSDPDPGSNPEWGVIVSYAFSLAAIGLIETVMTLEVVNEYVGEPPSTFRSNQECIAQIQELKKPDLCFQIQPITEKIRSKNTKNSLRKHKSAHNF